MSGPERDAREIGDQAWVLALHSSSETLGVALQPLGRPEIQATTEAFPLGRALSNSLLPCVEAVLPAREWRSLARLAVATGPGDTLLTRMSGRALRSAPAACGGTPAFAKCSIIPRSPALAME
jgi:hypothetical protein